MDQGPPPEEQRTTGLRDVPRPEQNQPSQGQANFTDSAGPLLHMYVKMTEGEDDKMSNRWQKDADGILIFTGLFSAALAAFAAVSVQDLKPNPQDTSAFYLANIYQLLADSNISRESILATPAQPPPFSPPRSAVLVNSLWFLSLVISLTCALLATMLQQWARRYVTITQPPRYSLHKRVPIHAFFANGVDKFHLPWSVEALPALLHLSLFLFFSGLALFLFNINHTVFSVVIWWVGLTGAVYGCITLMPIFWHDSPYYSPLSSSAWFFYFSIRYAASLIVYCLRFRYLIYPYTWEGTYRIQLIRGMTKAVQDTGSKMSVEITSRILTWTLDALDEDEDREQFFEAIPGFCDSFGLGPNLICDKVDEILGVALNGFMGRTLTSNLVLEADKNRRVITCARAVDTAHLTRATMYVLGRIFREGVVVLGSVEIGRSLRSNGDGLCSQGIIAGVIASVLERDDRWNSLAMDQLGVSEEVLQNGDSVLLANLIHTTRLFFHFRLDSKDIPAMVILTEILRRISRFDIRNTLPRVQHDFCALWNETFQEAFSRESEYSLTSYLFLNLIRHHYDALHQDANAASIRDPLRSLSSYSLCNIPGHHSDTVIGEITNPNLPSPPADSTEPVLSSIPASSEDHRRIHFAEQISLHDLPDVTPTVESIPPTNVDSNNVVTTSRDLIAQGPTDTTTMTTSPTSDSESSPHAPGVSTFTLHSPFASGSANLHVDLGVASDIPLSSSVASDPNYTIPAMTRTSLASPAFPIDQVTTAPLPLLSTSTTAILPAPPQGTSVSRSNINTANDGTVDDPPDPDLRYHVEALEQSQGSAMSIPEVATDVLRHPLDVASVSHDIDHPE